MKEGYRMSFSKRSQDVKPSPIRKLVPYAIEAKQKGKTVYHLNIGQPDIETPRSFFEAVKDYADNVDVLAYGTTHGNEELLKRISQYYQDMFIDIEPSDIIITDGGNEALWFTFMVLLDPGDEILIPEPFYANYKTFAASTGAIITPITTKVEEGFHLPPRSEILQLINDNTKAILLNNPGNPTGVVYSDEELKMIGTIASENNLFIIGDEVYREFVYDGTPYTSLGKFEELSDRVVLIDSVSKRYSACGARIGCMISKNPDFIATAIKFCQGRGCPPTMDQVGAANLYTTPTSYLEEVNKEYSRRRDVLYSLLEKIPGVVCQKPKGAFYIIAKLPVPDSEKFVLWLLNEFDLDGETLMMAPAEGFYSTHGLGKNEVRIAYVLKEQDLARAMQILKVALERYPEKTS